MDANVGLIEEGPDVSDYKSRLRELDSDLSCYYDTIQNEWIVVWHNAKRNREEFVLADEDLARAYHRVEKGRNDAPGAETGDEMSTRLEKEQDALKAAEMQQFKEIAGDAAERLIHAFKKDGLHDHEDIYGPKPRKDLAKKDVRIREPR
jgi:hypothetical protein